MTIVITGAMGCGKSTLARELATFMIERGLMVVGPVGFRRGAFVANWAERRQEVTVIEQLPDGSRA